MPSTMDDFWPGSSPLRSPGSTAFASVLAALEKVSLETSTSLQLGAWRTSVFELEKLLPGLSLVISSESDS